MSGQKTASKRRFRRSKLDGYAHLVGRVPDREVAAMAGITPDGVRMYRQRHKIPAYSSFKRSLADTDAAPGGRPDAAPPVQAAFTVSVREGGSEQMFVVVASDIVSAARRAAGAAAILTLELLSLIR